jgi:hypothetical protein
MQIRSFVHAYGILVIFGVSAAAARDKGAEPSARQQLQGIHTPQSLLIEHQREMEKAMQEREHKGQEDRNPTPPSAPSDPNVSAT